MRFLRMIGALAWAIFTFAGRICKTAFHQLFGDWQWQAPPWGKWIGKHCATSVATIRQHRRISASLAVCLVVLGVAGWYGWKWWQARPQPEVASYTVNGPKLTDYAVEGALSPNPVLVVFDRSVAPLARVNKDVTDHIQISPAVKGTWHWNDDRILSFQPTADWPIATDYRITLDKKLLASQIQLKDYQTSFRTAVFEVRIAKSEFYQDPTNPAAKNAVFDLGFSHPVNKAELEKHIELKLDGRSEGIWGVGRERTRFTISYDKYALNAYVHSEALSTPQEDSKIFLVLSKGIVAAQGGPANDAEHTQELRVPGLNSLSVSDLTTSIAQNSKGDPEHLIVVNLSATTMEKAIQKSVAAWVLPVYQPDSKPDERTQPYSWDDPHAVTDAVLKASKKLDLQLIPGEREHNEQHVFRYDAPVGRYIYVQIDRGLESFGGYVLPRRYQSVVLVPPFPPQLSIAGQGALLAMSGERKVAVMSRDLAGVEVELGRVLPAQLQHLVSQTAGDFANPRFFGSFGMDNLAERFETKIPINEKRAGKAHYEAVDLGAYLNKDGAEKRGVFLMRIRGYDPANDKSKEEIDSWREAQRNAEEGEGDGEGESTPEEQQVNPADLNDARLILVTDLGILVKRSLDGTQDVFVQSIASGRPVAGAQVDVIGKNGLTLMTRSTDANGRVQFDKLEGLTRERTPMMYLVRKEGDMSFLPLNRADRGLDFSRFDVGGIRNSLDLGQLTAHLFSDRGLYRPGDPIHVGMIVKAQNWQNTPTGLPMEAEVIDPRGLTVKREKFKLAAGGFNEITHTTVDSSPTGTYVVNLFLIGDGARQTLIGSTSVRVQEFLPDRMKVTAHLSSEAAEGWVSPEGLAAKIDVQNLFGTPAQQRRIEATMTLSPTFPSFRAFPDYQFHDPLFAKQSFTDTLNEATTDENGKANFDLDLSRFERASYRLYLVAKAFEPEGGRSVSADVATLVSELKFMVGYKPDGDMSYVSRGSRRVVSVLAVDPRVHRVAVNDLVLELVERRYMSVLARQNNGTFRYESRVKEVSLHERPFEINAAGVPLTLESGNPGNFFYRIKTREGLQLSRIEYSVVGDANITRSLERNAELQIALKKRDVAPGEEIELSIRAPYTGAGLITIERDRVYAHQWFKADKNSSVQKIRLPANFEGNGYVTVQYIRDPASNEIYMSPLSYGTVPFTVSRELRTNKLRISAPDKIKPGQNLHIKLTSAQPSRVVVFAVDEGILQVARYKLTNPLDTFFQKRSLDVRTQQILDLIMPEFRKLTQAAAPGGDQEGALARNLNPFKRKREKPAVYWSGIVDVQGEQEFSYTVPETFNGSLRLMAVSVNDKAIGIAEGKTIVQGDFVLLPNVPLAVAPGDEFDVSVGVANNVAGSGKKAPVMLSVQLPPALQAVGPLTQPLQINEHGESVAIFRLKTRNGAEARLGSASIVFNAALDNPKFPGRSARLTTDVSVRPATPFYTLLRIGSFKKSVEVPVQRTLHGEYRTAEVVISPLPLVLAQGLSLYLDNFSHLCTEQLTSRAMPAIVLGQRGDFLAHKPDAKEVQKTVDDAVRILRSRQNAEGGFGLWTASVEADEYASVYATHMLLEARDRGLAVPNDLLQKSLSYLMTLSGSPATTLDDARTRAYAIYLLTRQGGVVSAQLATLRETLDKKFKTTWLEDSTASYLAATYRLMKDERQAAALIDARVVALTKPYAWFGYANYYDPLVRDAQTLYIVSRHFPERARKISFDALIGVLKPLQDGRYNTHSAAYLILALDAWANSIGNTANLKLSIAEIDARGKAAEASAQSGLVMRLPFSPGAVKLRLGGRSDMTAYYSISEAGFDREPPKSELQAGLELIREYVDKEGKPVESVRIGEEVTVRLRFRAIQRGAIYNAALIDLLPGGFEPVLGALVKPADGEEQRGWDDRLSTGGTWHAVYGDVREERVVLYGTIQADNVQEYQYRIRATNAGRFIVPPAYGEALYERDVQGRSLPATISVERIGK